MKLNEIDEKLDTFFSGEPARSGNFSSTFLFYMFLPVIAGGALIYYSAKGIKNIIKKHKDKNANIGLETAGSTIPVEELNSESQNKATVTPITNTNSKKRSNKLTLRMR